MKRSLEPEMMDLADKPRDLFIEDLNNLRAFNRHLGGRRSVLKGLEHFACEYRPRQLTLLDVGTASGDIPVAAVKWARRRGLPLRIVALELDAVAAAEARELSRNYPEITVIQGDAAFPPFNPAAFDIVIASQLLHHFSEEQIIRLLRTWSRLARKAILVSDLVRHPLAYHGIRWISRLTTTNAMTRIDAPLSVERSFTLSEWRSLFQTAGVGPFRIAPVFPFRQITLIGTGAS